LTPPDQRLRVLAWPSEAHRAPV